MNTSVAVFDVIDEVIAPLSAEVPERPSVMEFYDPQFEIPPVLADTGPLPGRRRAPARSLADEVEQYTRFVAGMAAIGLAPAGEVTAEAVGLYRALRGGFIRGVVTGVFPARREPWEVRFFGDEDYTTVLHKLGNRARLRSGFLSELPGWVFDGLPERLPGPGQHLRIETDEGGLIPRRCERAVELIRECAARPRLGTVLVDLAVRDAILAEYPHGAFGLVDNDWAATSSVPRSAGPGAGRSRGVRRRGARPSSGSSRRCRAMREHASAEGPGEPARLGLTVRDAILAAAELTSDVPIPRSPAAAGPGEAGRRRPGEGARSRG